MIRTKVFSLKTPSKQGNHKESVQTKDFTLGKEGSVGKSDKVRQMSLKEFSVKMDRLNEEIFITIKMGRIDTGNPDHKKMLNFMSKLKNSSEEEFKNLQGTIEAILKFIDRHGIKGGVLEFRKIIQLTSKKVLSNHQILETFMNRS